MEKLTITLQIEYEGENFEEEDAYHDMVRAASDLAANHNVHIWTEDEDARTRSITVAYLSMGANND